MAALWAASDSSMGSEEAGEEDGDPLSQKSAGSASSYYSGPTQQMGEDKPDDAELADRVFVCSEPRMRLHSLSLAKSWGGVGPLARNTTFESFERSTVPVEWLFNECCSTLR